MYIGPWISVNVSIKLKICFLYFFGSYLAIYVTSVNDPMTLRFIMHLSLSFSPPPLFDMEKDFCKNNCYWNKKIIMLSVYFQVAVNFHLFLLGRYFNKCLYSIYFVILIQYSLLSPCPTEGPVKLLFVCLPVCLSVWCSSQEWVISFF